MASPTPSCRWRPAVRRRTRSQACRELSVLRNRVALKPQCFTLPLLTPGDLNGAIPAGDTFETNFTTGQRNIFRQTSQRRADISIVKNTKITERFTAKYSFDVFNLTNTPSFDIPLDDVSQNQYYNNVPVEGTHSIADGLPEPNERVVLQLRVRPGRGEQDHRQPAADSDVSQPAVLVQPMRAGTAAIPAAVPARLGISGRRNCLAMDAVKMRSMSKATARGPVQQLREQLARGDITPRAAAEAALSRANSNASHNVYLALDAEKVREEADTLPRRFPHCCQAASLRRPCFDQRLLRRCRIPDNIGFAFLRRTQRRGGRGFRRGLSPAFAGRDHHRQDAHASTGLRHHRRKSGLWRLRAATRRAATNRRVLQRRRGQRAGAVGAGGDRDGHRRFGARAGSAVRTRRIPRVGGAGAAERIVARRRAPGTHVRHAGMAVPGSARRAAAG